MNCKTIAAIIRAPKLGEVDARLNEIGVKGMSSFYMFSFGDEFNAFDPDRLTRHVKIEIWARAGMVAVLPVDKV